MEVLEKKTKSIDTSYLKRCIRNMYVDSIDDYYKFTAIASVDIETFSKVDLKRNGLDAYINCPSFEILLVCLRYAEKNCKPQTFTYDIASGKADIEGLKTFLTAKTIRLSAFNARFERLCINKYFGLNLPISKWDCTAQRALMMGLASTLGETAEKALKFPVEQQKKKGWMYINKFCMPVKPTKANGMKTRIRPEDAPEDWQGMNTYCKYDVLAENGVRDFSIQFDPREKENTELDPLHADKASCVFEDLVYEQDQIINDTGIKVDKELILNIQELLKTVRGRIEKEVLEITQIDNIESLSQLKKWITKELDYPITSISQQEIPKILDGCSNDKVIKALELRQVLSKSSVKKFDAILRCLGPDDRLRGMFKKHGANRTGRWSGQLVNLQNLPRNNAKDLDAFRNYVKTKDYKSISLIYSDREVFDYCSQLIRTVFISGTGLLAIADYAQIEARVIAWLSRETWRLDVFNGDSNIYEKAAEKMFNLKPGSVDKKSPYRLKGKIAELALAYQGSIGALKSMGALEMGLKEEELLPLVQAWRNSNPMIVQFWRDVETACIEAIAKETTVRLENTPLSFSYSPKSKYLFITLPSSRKLAYANARLETDEMGRTKIVYAGQDAITKKWSDSISSYGGKFVENICQAVARDLLAYAILGVSTLENVQTVAHVHDELVCEITKPEQLDEIIAVMCTPPKWATDGDIHLPLSAEGFTSSYYKKD